MHAVSKEDIAYLTCVLMYSLAKCVLEDDSDNFVKLTEIYLWRSLLLRMLQCLESLLSERSTPPNLRNLRNIQHN